VIACLVGAVIDARRRLMNGLLGKNHAVGCLDGATETFRDRLERTLLLQSA